MNLLSVQKHWVRYYMVRQSYKIGSMLHVKSDLNVLIRLYLDLNRWIGSDLQRSSAAWSGQEVSLGFAIAAHAACSWRALAARTRSQLLQKLYEFIHDNWKKCMNSYMIRICICMNTYLKCKKYMNSYTGAPQNYIWRSDSKPLKSDLRKSDITWQLEWNLVS